jgi:hypothetical protein
MFEYVTFFDHDNGTWITEQRQNSVVVYAAMGETALKSFLACVDLTEDNKL